MISTSRLRECLVGNRVVFDKGGEPLDIDVPPAAGSAVLLVSAITDAIKEVDGDVVASLDRDQMWVVQAIVLGREVLDQIGDIELTVEEVLAAVSNLGYEWEISPAFDP